MKTRRNDLYWLICWVFLKIVNPCKDRVIDGNKDD